MDPRLQHEIRQQQERIQQLEFELAVDRKVLGRLQAIAGTTPVTSPAGDNGDSSTFPSAGDVVRGSLTDHIVALFQAVGKPMRCSKIAKTLQAQGVPTKSAHGLLPNVVSTLRRRKDLFVNVDRGLYAMKKPKGGGQDAAAE